MRTRTKLWICAGLLTAAGVAVVSRFPARPAVMVSFVQYADKAAGAVLNFTNGTRSRVQCGGNVSFLALSAERHPGMLEIGSSIFVLGPQSETQLLAFPYPSPTPELPIPGTTISLQCAPQPSKLRHRIEVALRKVGINIASTGFVASVDLPPR